MDKKAFVFFQEDFYHKCKYTQKTQKNFLFFCFMFQICMRNSEKSFLTFIFIWKNK